MTVRTLEARTRNLCHLISVHRRCSAPAQAAELARIGVQIEELYGQPMDIEWALHDGHIFIVQARPITALPEVYRWFSGNKHSRVETSQAQRTLYAFKRAGIVA